MGIDRQNPLPADGAVLALRVWRFDSQFDQNEVYSTMRLAQLTRRPRRRGFTFIEIMLVVLIIGILMAVVVPNMVGRTKKAREQVTRQSIQSIETMLQGFEMRADRFPSTEEGLAALHTKPEGLEDDQWERQVKDLESLKDAWGQEFVYRSPGEVSQEYDIFSKGPDKQEGTADDVWKTRRRES